MGRGVESIGVFCKRSLITFMGMSDAVASGPNMYRLSTQTSTAPVASAALRRDSMMIGNFFSQTELYNSTSKASQGARWNAVGQRWYD